jgi:tetratricopeptide (TPR) repeat protein
VCLLFGVARADDASQARMHYQKATNLFAIGDFLAAASEYEEAYKLKPDPALLFNAAQALRLGGANEKAIILYKNYAQLYRNAKNITEVREQIAKLEEAIAAAQKAKTAPPTTTEEPEKKITEAPPPAPPAVVETKKEPEQPTPIYKKWWLWTAIGGVVVLAIVIPVAVVVTQPPPWRSIPDVGPGVQGLAVQW